MAVYGASGSNNLATAATAWAQTGRTTTWCAWIRPSVVTGTGTKYQAVLGSQTSGGTAGWGLCLREDDSTSFTTVNLFYTNDAANYSDIDGTTRLTAGTWCHVAWVLRTGNTQSCYLNGNPETLAPRTSAGVLPAAATRPWYIKFAGDSSGTYTGTIAYIRVFDGELTQAEIGREMYAPQAVTTRIPAVWDVPLVSTGSSSVVAFDRGPFALHPTTVTGTLSWADDPPAVPIRVSGPSVALRARLFSSPGGGTSASAGVATGTGAANNPNVNTAAPAGAAAGTGAAGQPAANVSGAAAAGTGTGTAGTAAGTIAGTAGAAAGTGAANTATPATTVPSGSAAGTGAANPAQASTAPTGTGGSVSTGTAVAPTPQVAVTLATYPAGTGSAYNATISTATSTSANATTASGGGTAGTANPAVAVTTTAAAGTGVANNATISTSAATTVNALPAAGTGAAQPGTTVIATTATTASASGVAYNASPVTAVYAAAGVATGTGTGYTPAQRVAPVSGYATGTGTAGSAGILTPPRAVARGTVVLHQGAPVALVQQTEVTLR